MNAIASARVVDLKTEGLVDTLPNTGAGAGSTAPAEAVALARLSALLQTSIELKVVLNLFFLEARRVLTLDGLTFTHQGQRLNQHLGDISGHSTQYHIQTDRDYLGELIFYREAAPFSPACLATLDRLITTLVFPLRNSLRYLEAVKASLTDGLTGAGNRISLDSMLDREVDQANRYEQALSVLILDLDHFKRINDSFGHSGGDEVLRRVARAVQNTSRNADMTFRYGGEEFVVLLTKTDVAGAKIGAERIRRTLEQLELTLDGQRVPVSASIGVASLCHGEAREDLLRRADRALYQAKARGRNRVVVAEPALAHA
ncbi:MAG: GGDEF domain-containing protein [Pseudomonadota bacterium]|nr:GGDEF domain-containing protein [Pseudomonadota bacterium]